MCVSGNSLKILAILNTEILLFLLINYKELQDFEECNISTKNLHFLVINADFQKFPFDKLPNKTAFKSSALKAILISYI